MGVTGIEEEEEEESQRIHSPETPLLSLVRIIEVTL
jgi:hypothetical protein